MTLNDMPLTSLSFFVNLHQQCFPPYYRIAGIHYDEVEAETDEEDGEIQVLGRDLHGMPASMVSVE